MTPPPMMTTGRDPDMDGERETPLVAWFRWRHKIVSSPLPRNDFHSFQATRRGFPYTRTLLTCRDPLFPIRFVAGTTRGIAVARSPQ